MKRKQYNVYKTGRGVPSFTGSLSGCIAFIRYYLCEDDAAAFTIAKAD